MLVFTPKQLARRAELFQQLAQLTQAGFGLVQALALLHRSAPARSFRPWLERVRERIEAGATFTDALRAAAQERAGRWLAGFDVALLEAGEKSGRLPACFALLGHYYTSRAQLARELISNLAYPAFLVHAAVFILAFPQLVLGGGLGAYLARTLGLLGPIWLAVLGLVLAGQSRHGPRWQALLERLLQPVPVLGAARRELALARLAMALEALINAGLNIIPAWDLAARASGSARLQRAVSRWQPALELGQTPAEVLSREGAFPELFANLYHTGEISGQLDESLRRLHRLYLESALTKLRALAQWVPRIIYLIIVAVLALQIVSFWTRYYNQIGSVLQ